MAMMYIAMMQPVQKVFKKQNGKTMEILCEVSIVVDK